MVVNETCYGKAGTLKKALELISETDRLLAEAEGNLAKLKELDVEASLKQTVALTKSLSEAQTILHHQKHALLKTLAKMYYACNGESQIYSSDRTWYLSVYENRCTVSVWKHSNVYDLLETENLALQHFAGRTSELFGTVTNAVARTIQNTTARNQVGTETILKSLKTLGL